MARPPARAPAPRAPATVTLFAVDLDAVRASWAREPIAAATSARPRGRLAALAGPPAVAPLAHMDAADRAQPPAHLLLSLGPTRARRLWDALVEDLADAALYDAPALALAEVLAAVARVSGQRDFESMRLEEAGEPAYPPELLEPAGASGPISVGGQIAYLVWMGSQQAAIAGRALTDALSLPVGAFPTEAPQMWRDLADALATVLAAAARPRHCLVASRESSPV